MSGGAQFCGADSTVKLTSSQMAPLRTEKQQLAKQWHRKQHHKQFGHLMLGAAFAAAAVVKKIASRYIKEPLNKSRLTGPEWVQELQDAHPSRFRDMMGMNKHVFHRLLEELERRAGLRDSKHIQTDEQLTIFLYICTTGLSVRKSQDRIQRSNDSILK